MATRYLCLRADKPIEEGFESLVPTSFNSSRGGPTMLSVTIENGQEKDAGALRADPQNLAVLDADSVFRLVTPKQTKDVDAHGLQISLRTLGAEQLTPGLIAVGAHASSFTGQGVRVAILDTGIDAIHPAFANKQIAKKNFTNDGADDDVTDKSGHGTHCAGTICGASVGGVRVGVAPNVTKLAVGKVLGPQGGTLEMFINGMLWAVMTERADVVSMSLGFDLPGNVSRLVARGIDPALAGQATMQLQNDIIEGITTLSAFLRSQSKNVIFLAASGNESARSNGFVLGAGLPASKLLAVGAVGSKSAAGDKWGVADFSNGRVQLVAPGVDVLSAAPGGGWAVKSGTSMATPHVAGVAALIVEKLRSTGGLSIPDSVRSILQTSVTRQPIVDGDIDAIGAGLVQAPAN